MFTIEPPLISSMFSYFNTVLGAGGRRMGQGPCKKQKLLPRKFPSLHSSVISNLTADGGKRDWLFCDCWLQSRTN